MTRLTVMLIQEADPVEVIVTQDSPGDRAKFGYVLCAYSESPSGSTRPRPLLEAPSQFESAEIAKAKGNAKLEEIRSIDLAALDCEDCKECARHAYSDATTPGFFFDKCEKHRTSEVTTK